MALCWRTACGGEVCAFVGQASKPFCVRSLLRLKWISWQAASCALRITPSHREIPLPKMQQLSHLEIV
jgi:hypothetical protein